MADMTFYCAPGHAGLPKHHVCNANLMRNGADYAVYINTAQEFDGCGCAPSTPPRLTATPGGARPGQDHRHEPVGPHALRTARSTDALLISPQERLRGKAG